jgi:hypothetical protein
VRHHLRELGAPAGDIGGVSEIAQHDDRTPRLRGLDERCHHRVKDAIADPDFFADRLVLGRREIERIKSDDVLEVRRVDVDVGGDAEHLARRAIDEHRAAPGVGHECAVGHRLDGGAQRV